MEMNRNQFFLFGLVVLLIGIQFRLIDSFVLNEKCTRFLADTTGKSPTANLPFAQIFPAVGPMPRKTVRPPQWNGWALVSTGSVLILHSLAMQKPQGGPG